MSDPAKMSPIAQAVAQVIQNLEADLKVYTEPGDYTSAVICADLTSTIRQLELCLMLDRPQQEQPRYDSGDATRQHRDMIEAAKKEFRKDTDAPEERDGGMTMVTVYDHRDAPQYMVAIDSAMPIGAKAQIDGVVYVRRPEGLYPALHQGGDR